MITLRRSLNPVINPIELLVDQVLAIRKNEAGNTVIVYFPEIGKNDGPTVEETTIEPYDWALNQINKEAAFESMRDNKKRELKPRVQFEFVDYEPEPKSGISTLSWISLVLSVAALIISILI
jgi:hypothetical protein